VGKREGVEVKEMAFKVEIINEMTGDVEDTVYLENADILKLLLNALIDEISRKDGRIYHIKIEYISRMVAETN
jgi:hypothetical protein